MTDVELLLKRLAYIESCVADLQRLAQPDRLADDLKERRFVEHTLQLAIQALQDVASHIVSDGRLGEPDTNQALLSLLGDAGWIDKDLVSPLRAAIGFRNVLVHGYADVDLDIVRDVLAHRLEHLSAFAAQIRARVERAVD